jgi:hypothetical protein
VSALFSIADLADMVFPRLSLRGILSMLCAYFDDTGTHDDSPLTAVAGLVGEVAAWTSLEGRCKTVLRDYGLTVFHAEDCEVGRPPFALPSMQRDILVREFANIIANHDPLPMSWGIEVRAWEREVDRKPSSAPFKARYRSL